MAISRIETSVARVVNNTVYGTGVDGNGIIASNISLSGDVYYNDLTVNSSCHLNTNGFRVFVKGTLTLNGTIGVNAASSVNTGTVAGKTPIATGASGIGGNAFGGTWTVSQIPQRLLTYVETAISGVLTTTSGAQTMVRGGAGGAGGVVGTATAATAAGVAGTGALTRNPLAPGGPGTAGTAGTAVPLAGAGSAGQGGGLVVIVARVITGSGQILSQGSHATAGGAAATGIAGTAGTTAPNQAIAHHSDGTSSYITGDGTHGPHATYGGHTPNLPHGSHVPHTSQGLHHDRYVAHHRFHNDYCPGGYGDSLAPGGFTNHHGHSPHNAAEHTPDYSHINGIPHNHSHRNHSGIAFYNIGSNNFTHDTNQPGHHTSGLYTAGHVHCSNSKGWFTLPINAQDRVGYGHTAAHRNAGTVSHAGHLTALGGTGGVAGRGAGTTAGTDGQSGGGGGIIIVTESSLPAGITTSALGGTVNSNTASSGTVLVITNA